MATELAVRTRWNTEDVERALLMVAHLNGNVYAASLELERDGLPVPRSTLQDWVQKHHVDRYQQIRSDTLAQTGKRIATAFEDSVLTAAEIKAEMYEELRDKAKDMKPADLGSAIRNLATDQGIAATHARTYRDLPSQITEVRSPEETLKRIARIVEGTATEITPSSLLATSADSAT